MVPERDKISILLLHTVPAYRILTHKMSTANIFKCSPRSPRCLLGEALNLGVFHLRLGTRDGNLDLRADTQHDLASPTPRSSGVANLLPGEHGVVLSRTLIARRYNFLLVDKAGPLKLNATRAKASAIDADILIADLRPSCWSRHVHVGLLSLVSGVLSVVQ
jgi:hypothetical protein